jgi:phage-related protein
MPGVNRPRDRRLAAWYHFWYNLRGGGRVKRLPAAFYQLPSGREPVRDWLKGLSSADRKIIGEDIKDVEFSWPMGMPLCRALGKGLWEVRSDLTGGRIAWVLFCIHEGKMVLLHAFIKKTQKMPDADLEIAIKRKKEIT